METIQLDRMNFTSTDFVENPDPRCHSAVCGNLADSSELSVNTYQYLINNRGEAVQQVSLASSTSEPDGNIADRML